MYFSAYVAGDARSIGGLRLNSEICVEVDMQVASTVGKCVFYRRDKRGCISAEQTFPPIAILRVWHVANPSKIYFDRTQHPQGQVPAARSKAASLPITAGPRVETSGGPARAGVETSDKPPLAETVEEVLAGSPRAPKDAANPGHCVDHVHVAGPRCGGRRGIEDCPRAQSPGSDATRVGLSSFRPGYPAGAR